MTTDAEAYEQGRAARDTGEPKSSCPYESHGDEFFYGAADNWYAGWNSGGCRTVKPKRSLLTGIRDWFCAV